MHVMKPYLILIALFGLCVHGSAQIQLSTYTFDADSGNKIRVEPLYGDSLSCSFMLQIPKVVKLHKHLYHSEHALIISGTGRFTLGEKEMDVKPGDLIFIPSNTPHRVVVTSNEPLKVLSVQSPFYDGTDRVLLEK